MGNSLAIATVTETFRQVLEAAALQSGVSGTMASTLRPVAGTAGLPSTGVNLYLYQIAENAALRNASQPWRRGDGTVQDPPRLALDLHYVLSFFGKEQNLEPQRIMGSVIRSLNSRPLLSRGDIRRAKGSLSYLSGSNLDSQVEAIRLQMTPMTLEELSKLWSVFFQSPYVLSLVYQVSAVLIQGEEAAQPALPVRERQIYVEPFQRPLVESILSRKGSGEPLADRPITLGDSLVLQGRQLKGEMTRVRLGEALVDPSETGDTRLTVDLDPTGLPPGSLRSGVLGAQVLHWKLMGEPKSPHEGIGSNVLPFILRPTIESVSASPIGGRTVDGIRLCKDRLTLRVSPKVAIGQFVVLFINEFLPPSTRSPRAYSFQVPAEPAAPGDATVDPLAIVVSDVAAGDYLVRIEVDGAESLLYPSPSSGDPSLALPRVTIS